MLTAVTKVTELDHVGLYIGRNDNEFREFLSATGVPGDKPFEELPKKKQEEIMGMLKGEEPMDMRVLDGVTFPEGTGRSLGVSEREYFKVPGLYKIETGKLDDFGDYVYEDFVNRLVNDTGCMNEMRRAVYEDLIPKVMQEEAERNTEYFRKTKKLRPVLNYPDMDNPYSCEKYLTAQGITKSEVNALCRRMLRKLADEDVLCTVEKIESYIRRSENEKTLVDIMRNFTNYPDERGDDGQRSAFVLQDFVMPYYGEDLHGKPLYGKPYSISVSADVLGQSYLKARNVSYSKHNMAVSEICHRSDAKTKEVEFDFAMNREMSLEK